MARSSLPRVAVGTVLRLGGDDWRSGRGLTQGADVVVVLANLTSADEEGWVWVCGHGPQCSYPHVESHAPCLEVLARVAALPADAP
ncbi:hypothetical protein [Salinispora arenicola]|uniref:hypothetical protein n=1 Tax=Salinispora arenicola TaxID=168697 RepID=UPI00035D6B0E|nr:hypothetical protein [Salinispora arenicola]